MTDVDAPHPPPLPASLASRQDRGEYAYQRGFGNEFASEAVAGALPAGPGDRRDNGMATDERVEVTGGG